MIAYHKHNEIDREQWDNCIRNSRGIKPYAYSWYLDIMSPGWEALVDDEYDSVFPIPGFKKFGIQYIATPIFLQQLGAFSPDKPEEKMIYEFLEFIPGFFKLIDLSIGQKITSDSFRVTEKVNLEMDLSGSYDRIYDNFTHHCKRNIEKALKGRYELIPDVKPEELINMFIMNAGRKISEVKMRDYNRLKLLMNFCLKNKKGRILGVRTAKRKLIYGLFLVEAYGVKTMLFVVNTPESRRKRIGYFAVDKLIKEYAGTDTILDFAGSSIPSIASFMKSFGCINIPYYRIYRNRLYWPVRLMK